MKKRNVIRFILAVVTLAVLALGWKYQILGWIVPAAMLAGIAGVLIFGSRLVCGHVCPRGAFLDVFVSKISPKKSAPGFMHGLPFKLAVLIGFAAFFTFSVYKLAGWAGLPFLFWRMCFFTTLIGLVLAFFINERAWCMICPIGTIEGLLRRKNSMLCVSDNCVNCGKCDKVCPTIIKPSSFKGGNIDHLNCIMCGECKRVCPVKAIK